MEIVGCKGVVAKPGSGWKRPAQGRRPPWPGRRSAVSPRLGWLLGYGQDDASGGGGHG